MQGPFHRRAQADALGGEVGVAAHGRGHHPRRLQAHGELPLLPVRVGGGEKGDARRAARQRREAEAQRLFGGFLPQAADDFGGGAQGVRAGAAFLGDDDAGVQRAAALEKFDDKLDARRIVDIVHHGGAEGDDQAALGRPAVQAQEEVQALGEQHAVEVAGERRRGQAQGLDLEAGGAELGARPLEEGSGLLKRGLGAQRVEGHEGGDGADLDCVFGGRVNRKQEERKQEEKASHGGGSGSPRAR